MFCSFLSFCSFSPQISPSPPPPPQSPSPVPPAICVSCSRTHAESVHQLAAETNEQAAELARRISTKQDLLELQQSNYRNFILSVTLRMSVLSGMQQQWPRTEIWRNQLRISNHSFSTTLKHNI